LRHDIKRPTNLLLVVILGSKLATAVFNGFDGSKYINKARQIPETINSMKNIINKDNPSGIIHLVIIINIK
jgi:hypothetical protein